MTEQTYESATRAVAVLSEELEDAQNCLEAIAKLSDEDLPRARKIANDYLNPAAVLAGGL